MSLSKIDFLKQFSKQALDNRISLFLGAGSSCDVGYPSWSNLFEPFAKDLNLDIDKCDLYALGQYYSNKHGSAALKKYLSEKINKNEYKSDLLNELIDVNFINIWTTNFDRSIEKNYENRNIPIYTISDDTHLSNLDLYKRINIFKMNGDINNPEKIIATQNDFECYKTNHQMMLTFFKRELVSNTFLFIGYSFTDKLVLECLNEIKYYLGDSANYHYAILKKDNTVMQEYFVDDLEKRYHIKVLLVDEYKDITITIKELNEKIRKKKIFISGAFTRFDENIEIFSHEFSKYITEALYEKDYRIINGIGSRFGTHLIGYANEYLVRNGIKNIDKYLIIKPFVSNEENAKMSKRTTRESIIKQCGTALFLFGENDKNALNSESGVIEEFEIAKEQSKTLIPIAYSGMVSEILWKKTKSEITGFPYLEKVINELTNRQSPEKISKIVVNILESTQD